MSIGNQASKDLGAAFGTQSAQACNLGNWAGNTGSSNRAGSSTRTPHPNAEVLHAYADGKTIQYLLCNEWHDWVGGKSLLINPTDERDGLVWRVKPVPQPVVPIFLHLVLAGDSMENFKCGLTGPNFCTTSMRNSLNLAVIFEYNSSEDKYEIAKVAVIK